MNREGLLRRCRLLRLSATVMLISVARSTMGFDLEMASVVFRHGDRSPTHNLPNNTCDESCWPQGFGQLTRIGMRQHFMLGEVLRKRYSDLVNETYIRQQVYVRSTNKDRTLMSAGALLSSLYWPVGYQKFENKLPWQPIPVHTVRLHNDPLLHGYSHCPKFTQLYNALPQTENYQLQEKKYASFMKWVQQASGVDYNVTILTAHSVADVVRCQHFHNMSQPWWVNTTVLNKLEELSSLRFKLMFEGQEAHRLSSGVLVNEISDHMNQIARDNSMKTRLYLYSAHDTTVSAFLSGLGIFNNLQPPYAAAALVELYSKQLDEDKKEYYVQVFYRNITTNIDSPLADLTPGLAGCAGTSPCRISAFQSIAAGIRLDDWQSACQVKSSSSSSLSSTTIAIICVSVALGLAALGTFLCVFRRRLQKKRWTRIPQPDAT